MTTLLPNLLIRKFDILLLVLCLLMQLYKIYVYSQVSIEDFIIELLEL
jgi:hypothetical protein